MSTIEMLPRIAQRHPDITFQDVHDAIRSMLTYMHRETGEWVAVGFDGKGRFIELVSLYNDVLDSFLVYHAMTPPSRKTLRELHMER